MFAATRPCQLLERADHPRHLRDARALALGGFCRDKRDPRLGVDARAIATAMAAEFRSVITEMLQQPRQSGDSGMLVAAINDMVREQRTTNTISQRMLQVAQN